MKKAINDERIRVIIASKCDENECAVEVDKCVCRLLDMIQKVSPSMLEQQGVFSTSPIVNVGRRFSEEQWKAIRSEWLIHQVGYSISDEKIVQKERYGHNPDFLVAIDSDRHRQKEYQKGYWELRIIMQVELYNSIGENEMCRWSDEMARAMKATVGYTERVNRLSEYYCNSGIFEVCRDGFEVYDVGKNLERELPGTLWRMLCTEKHIEILGGIEKMKETLPVFRIDETVIGGKKGAWIQLTEDINKVDDEQRLKLRMKIEGLLPKINIALAVRNKKKGGRFADYPVYTEEEKKLIREYGTDSSFV